MRNHNCAMAANKCYVTCMQLYVRYESYFLLLNSCNTPPIKAPYERSSLQSMKTKTEIPTRRVITTTTVTDYLERPSTVFSPSGVTLNEDEIHLLSLGTFFFPHPMSLNQKRNVGLPRKLFQTCMPERVLHGWRRKVGNDVDTPIWPASAWMPPKGRDASLETYMKRIRMDVESQLDNPQAKQSKDNLRSRKRRALKSLRQQTDIIIKPTDKGSAVFMLNEEGYTLTKTYHESNNTTCSRKQRIC